MAHLCFLFIFIRRFPRRSTTVNFTSCSVRETCIPAFKVCFASTYFKRKSLIHGLQVIQAQEKGIDAIIDEDTTHMADIWE